MYVFENCQLFDGVGDHFVEGMSVAIEGDIIKEVSDRPILISGAHVIDCSGKFLMPGLIDAHFHAYSVTFDMQKLDAMPKPLLVSYAISFLEATARRGFTTVRDPAGGDVGLAMAIERGLINGPRFHYGGKAMSQTGGHGDMRPGTEEELCNCSYSGVLSEIVDGVDAVRKFAREELRKGAHHLKVFISGGIASPSDPIWMPQFTDTELCAAVEEARTRRKYVIAHCHTNDGAQRCVDVGIRSIDHATEVSEATAKNIATAGFFTVPTLAVYHQITQFGDNIGMSAASRSKVSGVIAKSLASIENFRSAGVKVGFGTDLFAPEYHDLQASEFKFRSEADKPIDVLRSATSVNAELLQREHDLGQIASGFKADLIVLNNNPLNDITIFERYAGEMPVVMKGGNFLKNQL